MSTLTVKETLAIEVLIARHRLGESLWTFDIGAEPTLDKLAKRGLVDVMGGVTEHTVRAMLSDKGRKKYMSKPYDSPALHRDRVLLDSIVRSAKSIITDAEKVV